MCHHPAMRWLSLYVCLAALVGCTQSKGATQAPQEPVQCDPADPFACIEARRAMCTKDTKVWRIDSMMADTALFSEFVTEHGLRVRHGHGREMYTVDSETWLACVPGCQPDGAAACVPLASDLRGKPIGGCAETTKRRTQNGYPTVEYECEVQGNSVALLVAPGLEELVKAGAKAGVADPAVAGYPLLMSAGGTAFVNHRVTASDCSEISDATDEPQFISAAHQARSGELLLTLNQELEEAEKQQKAEMAKELTAVIEKRVIEELGELCFGEPGAYKIEEIQACTQAKPDVAEKAVELSQTLGKELMLTMIADFAKNDLEAEIVSIPLCKEIAAMGQPAQ